MCFKYWWGPSELRQCRFGLDAQNYHALSSVDVDTEEISLHCLNRMINFYNEIILSVMHCNMDIQFIGSDQSAKAILSYITDYITKTQLKVHVAYAALEATVNKIGEYNLDVNNLTFKAKCLLQKYAYALISYQELLVQQVCLYIMDYDDHYTSHTYCNIYWTMYENFIEAD